MSMATHLPRHRLAPAKKRRLRRVALIAILDPTGRRTYDMITREIPPLPAKTMTDSVNTVSISMKPPSKAN
jgi:hypothetical protein